MYFVNRLDCRGSHVLFELDGRFGVVEERNGKIYNLRAKPRQGFPNTPEGIAQAIDCDGWQTEVAAYRLFDDLTRSAEHLARRIW